MMLEYLFFSWVLGLNEIYDLDPNHLPIKLVFLVICFFSAQFSIKYTKIDKFFEEEKKKLDK